MTPPKVLLSSLIIFLLPPWLEAEYRTVLVVVKQGEDRKLSISLYSDEKEERRTSVSLGEAISVLEAMKGWGSSVGVHVSAEGAARDVRRKLLRAINENPWLDLEYFGPDVPRKVADHFLETKAQGKEAAPPRKWDAGLFAGAFMFDSVASFRKYLLAADAIVVGELLRWDAEKGGKVRVRITLHGSLPKEVEFAPNGGLTDAKPGEQVIVVLRKDGRRLLLHSSCGASGLYKDSKGLREVIAQALAEAPPRPVFEEVILQVGKPPQPSLLYLILTAPDVDHAGRNDLVVRHADAALREANHRRFKDADPKEPPAQHTGNIVFVIRKRPTDSSGFITGFSLQQLRDIASAPPQRARSLASEHAWTLQPLPKRQDTPTDDDPRKKVKP